MLTSFQSMGTNFNLIVATDGSFIEPIETDYIIIHTGERYDFLFTADQRDKVNFLIRAETLEVNCEILGHDANLERNDAIAVLTYNNSNVNRAMIEDEYINGKKVCSESSICTVANCPFEKYPASLGYNNL